MAKEWLLCLVHNYTAGNRCTPEFNNMARDSEESTPQEIIEEWLVDYVYACVLEEFGNHGTFETNFNRDFIQGKLVLLQKYGK